VDEFLHTFELKTGAQLFKGLPQQPKMLQMTIMQKHVEWQGDPPVHAGCELCAVDGGTLIAIERGMAFWRSRAQ
jgi:hypothetical protein